MWTHARRKGKIFTKTTDLTLSTSSQRRFSLWHCAGTSDADGWARACRNCSSWAQVDRMLTMLTAVNVSRAVAKDIKRAWIFTEYSWICWEAQTTSAVILVICSSDWSCWLVQEIIRDCLEEAEESFPEEVHIQDSFGPDKENVVDFSTWAKHLKCNPGS